jgi:hypothetical protein
VARPSWRGRVRRLWSGLQNDVERGLGRLSYVAEPGLAQHGGQPAFTGHPEIALIPRRSEAVRLQVVPPAVLPVHVETDGGAGEEDVDGGTAAELGDEYVVAVQGQGDGDLAGAFGIRHDGVAVTVEIRGYLAPRRWLAASRSGWRSVSSDARAGPPAGPGVLALPRGMRGDRRATPCRGPVRTCGPGRPHDTQPGWPA